MPASSHKKKVPLKFVLPPGLELGAYASIVQVQVRTHDFIITFYEQFVPPSSDDSQAPSKVEARGVARVVIPKGVMGGIIDAFQTVQRKAAESDAAEGAEE